MSLDLPCSLHLDGKSFLPHHKFYVTKLAIYYFIGHHAPILLGYQYVFYPNWTFQIMSIDLPYFPFTCNKIYPSLHCKFCMEVMLLQPQFRFLLQGMSNPIFNLDTSYYYCSTCYPVLSFFWTYRVSYYT